MSGRPASSHTRDISSPRGLRVTYKKAQSLPSGYPPTTGSSALLASDVARSDSNEFVVRAAAAAKADANVKQSLAADAQSQSKPTAEKHNSRDGEDKEVWRPSKVVTHHLPGVARDGSRSQCISSPSNLSGRRDSVNNHR